MLLNLKEFKSKFQTITIILPVFGFFIDFRSKSAFSLVRLTVSRTASLHRSVQKMYRFGGRDCLAGKESILLNILVSLLIKLHVCHFSTVLHQ